jgi:hypothetical protein
MSRASSHPLPSPPLYNEYLSTQQILQLTSSSSSLLSDETVKKNSDLNDHDHRHPIYVIGTFIVIPNNPHSYVEVKNLTNADIVIKNLKDRNRATNHDQVLVEIFPVENWVPFNQKKLEQNHQDDSPIDDDPNTTTTTINDPALQQLWKPNENLLQEYSSSSTPPASASAKSSQDLLIENILQESLATQLQPRGRIVGILPSQNTSKVLYGNISLETPEDIKQASLPPSRHDHDQGKKVHHQQDPSSGHGPSSSSSQPLLLFHPNDPHYMPMIVPSSSSHLSPTPDPTVTYKATVGNWPINSHYPLCGELHRDESKGTITEELEELLQNYSVHTGACLSFPSIPPHCSLTLAEEYPLTLLAPLLDKLNIHLPSSASDSTFGEWWSLPICSTHLTLLLLSLLYLSR